MEDVTEALFNSLPCLREHVAEYNASPQSPS
jgi:hypothetical protein